MKQYLSRQLWMLAILLFAGVGNAFGYTITANIDGLPYGSGGVVYNISGIHGDVWASTGVGQEFDANASVFMKVQSLNSVYAIKKVEILDGTNTTDITNTMNQNGDLLEFNFGVLDKDYTVNVEFYEKNPSVKVMVSWTTTVFPGLSYHFANDLGEGWIFAKNLEDACVLEKDKTFYLHFDNLSSLYNVSSITLRDKDNNEEDVTEYYNNNGSVKVYTDKDYDIDIVIAKVQTNTINVDWANTVANVEFQNVNNWSYMNPNESGKQWELPSGKTYQMRVELKNPLVYSVNSVKIGENDVINTAFYSVGWGGTYWFEDLSVDNDVTIGFDKVANTKTITVNFDENKAHNVELSDPDNEKYLSVGDGDVTEVPESSTIRMIIEPQTGWKLDKITVDNDNNNVITTYNENNYYDFPTPATDHSVNVVFAQATTYTITPTYDNSLTYVNFDNGIYTSGAASEEPCVFNAGSKVTMIMPVQNTYLTTISVDGGAYFTPEIKNGRYEYVFDNGSLNSIHTVDVQLAPKPTGTVTVTWGNDCNGVDFIDENDNWFSPTSGEPETLPTGSTYKMIINLNDPWTYRPLVTIAGGNPVAATFNSNKGRYEYEIGALSQDQNLTFTVSVEQRPTRPVTVTWDYSKVKVEFVPQQGSGDIIKVVSGTACNLTDGIPYRMYVNFPDNNLYNLASITVDGNGVTGDYVREYRDNGYLAFDAISAEHAVYIGINKSVETNTITVDWDADAGNVQFHDTDYNWFNIDPEDKDCELPTGNTYEMGIYPYNHLVCSVSSVTVDGQDVVDYNNNGYTFENLDGDHEVAVVFNKVPSNTVTVTWDENNGDVDNLYFCDESENNRVWTQRGNATELPINATVKLRIEPSPGYVVKTLKDGNVDVTADFVDGWYVFENPSDDHIVTIEFETVETQKITVAYDTDHTYDLFLNGYWVGNNGSKKFNKGSDVTMTISCEDGYKPVLTIDAGNPITLDKNQDGQYKYVFSNLSADHSVSIAYAQIEYKNITVIFDYMAAQLNTAQNSDYYIPSNSPCSFEKGTDVTLVLSNFQAGHKITSIMDGETDITAAYNANGYYTFENLSSDHVVTVNLGDVTTHYISVGFDQYSQGTVYLESDMTGKEEANYRNYNEGSDVTLTIEPAIGYEVSSIMVKNRTTNVKEDVVGAYNNNGFKYVFSNLSAHYDVTITTQKKSMAGIDPIAFTLGDEGMCTYCSEYDLDFTNVSGITAYIASGFNPTTGSVVLTKVKQVPAGTGLIISGKPGNYEIPVVETNYYSMNMFTGVVKPTQIPDYEWTNGIECACYILQDDGIFHFSNGSSNPLAANKAYLQIPRKLVKNTAYSPIMIEWDLKGDVNGDGEVDIADAVRIVNFIVGKINNLSRRIDNSIDNNPGEPE